MSSEFPAQEGRASGLPSYFPALDGLRAMALIMVMASHWLGVDNTGNWLLDLPIVSVRISWIGIDLFFVISGFLITGILLDTRETPGFFKNFYARRALRILPLYYLVLVCIVYVMPAIPYVWNLPNYRFAEGKPLWDFLFLTNIAEGIGFANSRLLVPYWSLAVEEHFYMVWPLVVFRFSHILARVCIGGIVFSCATRIIVLIFLGGNDRIIGFLTPCRVDSLLAGALVAVLARRGPVMIAAMVRWARVLAPASFLSIPLCLYMQEVQGRYKLFYGGQNPYVVSFGFFFFALFFASLLVLCVFGGFAQRIMTCKPAVAFGRFTYCGYLIHEPVHVVVFGSAMLMWGNLQGGTARWALATLGAFVVTVALAKLSWHYFESPILSLKRYFRAVPGAGPKAVADQEAR